MKLLGRTRKNPPLSREAGQEWQEAVNAAQFGLELDSLFQYGLIEPDPGVDVSQCLTFLRQGERIGIKPIKEGLE